MTLKVSTATELCRL